MVKNLQNPDWLNENEFIQTTNNALQLLGPSYHQSNNQANTQAAFTVLKSKILHHKLI